ncbi:hypothetical protein [Streptomyces sp. NPDC000410]|uniref:hypothetical protein n=1 Tax=Streptomyces sp. NPDC000410 TaxID=3154254 RepID=UPI0033176CDC
MAEQHDADHDADRERDQDQDQDRDRERTPQPIDEEAAWAAIVAAYGEEPADPPGAKPFKSVEDLAGLEKPVNDASRKGGKDGSDDASDDAPDVSGESDGSDASDKEEPPGASSRKPLGSSIVFAPGVGGGGPRDYEVAEASDDDFDESDEGHFVPPEPPPLPEADTAAKFAWLAVIGGPVLLLLAVLLQWEMTWWLTTLGVGGFLGGFATLVARMAHGDDEDDDDPGRGAVV